LFFFMHIPKTAGTSMRNVVRASVAPDQLQEVYENQLNLAAPDLEFVTRLKARTHRLQVVFGHFSFGVHRLLDIENARYLVMLRDPIQRAVSFFGHASRESQSPHHRAIKNGTTLKQLILSHRAPELNNHAVRMLVCQGRWAPPTYNSASEPQPIDQLLNPSHLDQAIDHIQKHFCFVGTTERFAESLSLLPHALGAPPFNSREIPRLNVRPDIPSPLDSETIKVIQQYNALDIELHRRFNRQPLLRHSNPFLMAPGMIGEVLPAAAPIWQ
jgi:hypothetical protein